MRSFFAVLLFASLGVCLSAQTPSIRTINGVLNAASYAQTGMPNSPIAQGAMITIFGTNLGPATLQEVNAFPITSNLAGTSVNIKAGGTTTQAPMIFTSAGQVAAVMPSTTPVGTVSVSVTYNKVTSSSYNVQVAANSFGTFAINSQGNGTGLITGPGGKVFVPNFAAIPNDTAVIWGTGLGALPYNDADQPTAINLTNIPVELYIGGQKVPTTYQGPSCCAGINQIQFTVPTGGVEGCSVPVEVKINNIVSPAVTMPITSNADRVCSDPNGISSSIWEELFSKASFNLGFVDLSRTSETFAGVFSQTTDTGSAGFINVQPLNFLGGTTFQVPAIGSCLVTTYTEGSTPSYPTLTGLDAGPVIDAKGPNGTQAMTPVASEKGFYATTNGSTSFLSPGSWTISNGSGGAAVGPFSFNMTFPQPVTWTNQSSINTVDRANGVTVTWTGGAPGTFAKITGFSVITGPPGVVAEFTCTAPIAQGTFTVGPDVLLQLPASTTGELSLGNSEPYTSFTATGLDYGFAQSSVLATSLVAYK